MELASIRASLIVLHLALAVSPSVLADEVKEDTPNRPPAELVVNPKATQLQLTVLDDRDAPIPNAKVSVRTFITGGQWPAVSRFECDEQGKLSIDLPKEPPRFFVVQIEKPGHAPFYAEWEPQGTPPDPVSEAYTARLDPGQLIGGVVQDQEGRPIRGAKVGPHFNLKMREERTQPLGSGANVTTDDDGRWTYPSFPMNLPQLTIRVSHPDYAATRVTQPTANFALAEGATPSGVIVMEHGIPIRGKVVDADGKPIAGTKVIYHELSMGGMPDATTDEEGNYRIANGIAGEKFMTATAKGWAPAIKNVAVKPAMESVDFQLTRGRPLSVRVVDSEGKPLSGVRVTFWTWQEHPVLGRIADSQGDTDADGKWQWKHAPDGTLRFEFSKKGYSYVHEHELKVGNEENVVTMKLESVAETRVLKVSGSVIDAETKQPIARFRVTPGDQRNGSNTIYWHQQSQSVSRNGQYRREYTPNMSISSAHALRVEADGYVPAISRVIRDDEEEVTIDFALQPGKDSDFLVLTPEGTAAKNANVGICTPELGPFIEDGSISPNSTCERTTTGEEGRFSLAPRDGVFALMIVHETGAAYVTQLDLQNSKTIQLAPWARVEGTLRIGGKPAANEPVTLRGDEPPGPNAPKMHCSYRTTTDQKGKFVFERVVPGGGQLQRNIVSKLDGGMSSWIPTHVIDAEFPAGETTRVDLSRDGRPVVGKFVVPEGLEKVNDWRLAMVSLQSARPAVPKPPQIPFPDDIDPAKDRDAAMKWWDKWKESNEGKAFQELIKQHNAVVQAISSIRTPSYGAKVEPDGSFAFDDIPSGNYQLTVSAQSRPANGQFGPGKIVATLTHGFFVETPEEGSAAALDLGDLKLQPTNR